MRLYLARGTISIAVAIALEEAGLDYAPELVDFSSAAQTRPAYLAINPKGRVPSLITPDGVLTETGAILEYIAALAPEAQLIPKPAFEAAKMREVMYFIASTLHVNHAHKMRGHRWADQEASFADMRAKVPQTMRAACAYLEVEAMRGPFVLGERVSLADAYLFVACTWLAGDEVDVTGFPKLYAFMAAMEGRASVRAVRARGWL
ncbi:glutathione S-transferase family protein [Pseudorhodobacter sp. E13]|uniref:glutathione S-transferase family protein n=1 Tax=Pseudorhodobacter sp. E13 TaxID=2487931 RepID=UPI000F8EBA66|nr:glutathione S-transferase family protein [Pseudorhodobacter sp. E13]RUS59480.1 glutathione S-transferase family protein [Pseudorhodobacter sp. E13]